MSSRFKSIWYQEQARRALQRRRIAFGVACLKKLALIAPHRAAVLVLEAAIKILVPLKFRRGAIIGLKRRFMIPPSFYHKARSVGINLEQREERIIVTLTTYPKRIKTVSRAIHTLLCQTYRPDKIVLWLAPEQFPDGEKGLPHELIRLKQYGLTIDWYHDIRSFKKLIPALKKYPRACLVTADDDIYYPPDWLEKLVVAHGKYPKCVVCHGAHRIQFSKNGQVLPYRSWKFGAGNCSPGYNVLVTSGAGALYAPGVLHPDVLKEELFRSLCPNADDIWFWAMSVKNDTKIKIVDQHIRRIYCLYGSDNSEALCARNMREGNDNDVQLSKVLNVFPEVVRKLIN